MYFYVLTQCFISPNIQDKCILKVVRRKTGGEMKLLSATYRLHQASRLAGQGRSGVHTDFKSRLITNGGVSKGGVSSPV